jgi:UDP-N-acetylmuramyl pentapeptide phosphotransferase/UDP-N-acetylglucosamine-1-phosphate transferase
MSKRKKKKPTQVVIEKKTNSTELMGGLMLNLVLAIVPAIVPLSVVLRWLIWFVCWIVFVFVLQLLVPILGRTSKKQRILVTTFLSILFVAWWPLSHSQWRQEKAEAIEGDLIGAGPVINDGKPHGFPFLQVGETVYIMLPNGTPDIMPFFPDSGIRLDGEQNTILYSRPR